MSDKYLYVSILILICCISAASQVLLKKAASQEYDSFLRQFLNLYVICGYSLLFLVIVVNIYLLRFIPIYLDSAFAESLPLVLSFISGKLFFDESITSFKILGGCFIIIGIILVVL